MPQVANPIVWVSMGNPIAQPLLTASTAGTNYFLPMLTQISVGTPNTIYFYTSANTVAGPNDWITPTNDDLYRHWLQNEMQRQLAANMQWCDMQLDEAAVQALPPPPAVSVPSPADEKAMSLLREHLSDDQRGMMEQHNWFIVIGGETRKRYRIKTRIGLNHNIEELNESEERMATICFHGPREIPHGDHLLAQKICLESDERRTLAIANRSDSQMRPAQRA